MTLKGWLTRASKEGWATGHFNISNLEQLHAICEAGKIIGAPLLIGVSEGERDFVGLSEAVAVVSAVREKTEIPIFLNADHSKTVVSAMRAVDAGFDGVHIDLSAKSYEDNVSGTTEVVRYAREVNPDISVEGELGYLRGDSQIQKEVIEIREEDLTDSAQAREFVLKTGVDRFAGVYGNLHGIAANEPRLDIERIKAVKAVLPQGVTLVLHGGSGIPDEQVREAISCGIGNVHVNTEIRLAYTNALRLVLAKNPDETTPYKLFPEVIDAVSHVVSEKLTLFGSVKKI